MSGRATLGAASGESASSGRDGRNRMRDAGSRLLGSTPTISSWRRWAMRIAATSTPSATTATGCARPCSPLNADLTAVDSMLGRLVHDALPFGARGLRHDLEPVPRMGFRTLGATGGERKRGQVRATTPALWRKPSENCYSVHPRQAHLSSDSTATRPERGRGCNGRVGPAGSSANRTFRPCRKADISALLRHDTLKIVIPGFANRAWLRGRQPLLADALVPGDQFGDQLPRTRARAICRGWYSDAFARCASLPTSQHDCDPKSAPWPRRPPASEHRSTPGAGSRESSSISAPAKVCIISCFLRSERPCALAVVESDAQGATRDRRSARQGA